MKKEIKKNLKQLRKLAKEIGFNGFATYSQRDYLEFISQLADALEEDLK